MRSCQVPNCGNPKSNDNVNMRYGKYAICSDCLDRATEFYILCTGFVGQVIDELRET